MAIFDNCLLASDIDGTLVDMGRISPRNLEAIDFFRKNGGKFALATGRSTTALGQVFESIDKAMLDPCVVLNGGMIYDYKLEKSLYSTVLVEETKCYVNEIKNTMKDIGIEVHSDSLVFVLNKTDESELHEDYEGLEREYVAFDDIKNRPWNKVLYTCDNQEASNRLFDFLKSLDDGRCNLMQTGVVINGVRHNYIEQCPKNTTKAAGLRELCKILDIKQGGFFAVGDYYNDVEMLRAADISATPSDAPEDIKKLADFVGGSCRDGAVADFIEYLTALANHI